MWQKLLTVVFTNADFWIEMHVVTFTTNNASGSYNSAVVTLDRGGRLVGVSIVGRNVTSVAQGNVIGHVNIQPDSAGTIDHGDAINDFRVRLFKDTGGGAAEDISYVVMMYLRK